ncbi:MAG: lysophospholipid acyltransferase family protein [Bacteroidota bacterium]
MKIIRGVHAAYTFVIFTILFILFFPLFIVPIIFKSQHHLVGVINRWWARSFLTLSFFPFKTEFRFAPKKGQSYVFCPNHFSYLDIPTMGLNKVNTIFVGKNDMEKIPLFGFMYSKLHITVDRNSLKSRYTTVLKSKEAVDEGKSLVIFPEGGIVTSSPPQMAKFKDGAFRIAIEKQIPIIPVTIPYNWIILPDSTLLPKRLLMTTIYHEPIETKGLSMSDVGMLKQKTFDTINSELKVQLEKSEVNKYNNFQVAVDN